MGSNLSSYPNWNTLPNEIKLKIIQNADKSSRLALKACSLNDHQLVASVQFRSIYKMRLWNAEDGKWRIDIIRNMYSHGNYLIFDTFEEFKKKLDEEIENSDYIDHLDMDQEETSNQLKFTKAGELLKVRELKLSAHNQDAPNILSQIDPSFLKYLKLHRKGVHQDIFETPQVKRVHQLQVHQDITDDQLLAMENPIIFLGDTENITLAGINQFIKKCLLNLDSKPVYFRFERLRGTEQLFQGIENQIIIYEASEGLPYEPKIFKVGTRLNNYQLEIKHGNICIEGRTIGKNQHPERQHTFNPLQSSSKSVDSVTIEPGQFTIAERNTAPVTYISDSTEGLQKKLLEEMNKINYIKHLKLQDTSFNWQLCPPNKQATIGQLSVHYGSLNNKFLQQFEPIHLKGIKIHVYSESDDGNSESDDGNSESDDGNSESDDGNSELDDGNSESDDGNSESDDGNSESDDGNSELDDGNSESDDGNSESDDGKDYNMPQFIHAQKLHIINCWMKDEDLIRMNAIQIIMGPGRPIMLTNSGINKFIKKILTNLNLHDYNFQFYHSGDVRNASVRFEGLDIFSDKRMDAIYRRIIVNSPFPEFKLELLDMRGYLERGQTTVQTIGNRITAEDAEKLLQELKNKNEMI